MQNNIPDPPWETGTLLKHIETGCCGVVIENWYFDDRDAKIHGEEWLTRVLINEKIVEGWEFDWEDWIQISHR